MMSIGKDSVNFLTLGEEADGQRLDNFLFKTLKGVPKSHVQRMIRNGEVRINKKRARADTRLNAGDEVRIPPVRIAVKEASGSLKHTPAQEFPIVYEDDTLLVINKPAGTAVHGGSGVAFGVIEQLRRARPDARYLELVHRLDKDTSGLLMIAKKRSTLVKLHEQLRQNHPEKIYLALCAPRWPDAVRHVKLPLIKYSGAAGEKMVRVADDGQYAHTAFRVQEHFQAASLVEADLKTGRTHQIRVHMQSQGCPILGDERYGDYERNREWTKIGLKRMFLHAYRLSIIHPLSGEKLVLTAELPSALKNLLEKLRGASHLS
ncbi:MAG: 23S rRNA pseudouridine(955/2504/2580) synthase RluC [Neisseria sp.]|nr:23S rRNA pseudouridine(955/2504/2580) synthase RluC [Neisseria sp.]